RAELTEHRSATDSERNFVLLERNPPERIYVPQTGFIGGGLPNHNTRVVTTEQAYRLAEGQQRMEVRFEAEGQNGVKVAKTYVFERGAYTIGVRQEILDGGAQPLQPYAYYQTVRDGNPPEGDSKMLPTYTGVAVYTDEGKYQKVDFEDIDKGKTPYTRTADDGWI